MARSEERLDISQHENDGRRRVRSRSDVVVPRYSLYGDTAAARPWFVNVEPLDRRASALDWTIDPHTHPKFTQLVFVADGRGEMTLDGDTLPFAGPCVLVVPAFRIHGFRYAELTTGTVVTIENNYLGDLISRAPDLRSVLESAGAYSLSDGAHAAITAHLGALSGELAGGRKGSVVGTEIQLLQIVLAVLRDRPTTEVAAPLPRSKLVDQFLELVEARYREQPDVETLSADLGVTSAQLRAACQAQTGLTPLAILHDRITAEAKRCLTYTTLPVAEIGYSLGFDDAPYFTRFFTRTAGVSPTKFRLG